MSLLALKGRWPPLRPRARIHSFNANSDLLISAPSIPKRKRKRTGFSVVNPSRNCRVVLVLGQSLRKSDEDDNSEWKLTSLSVSRGRICSSFVSSQIDE